MFDPFAQAKLYRDHPELFIRISDIVAEAFALRAIRKAETMDALKSEFLDAARAAKDCGDEELLARLTEAKDIRKAELENA